MRTLLLGALIMLVGQNANARLMPDYAIAADFLRIMRQNQPVRDEGVGFVRKICDGLVATKFSEHDKEEFVKLLAQNKNPNARKIVCDVKKMKSQ